jgi:DNA primase
MPSNFQRFAFRRERLPSPTDFYAQESVTLRGEGPWRNALCPFHPDRHPSLRVFVATGAFRCMCVTCGVHGADVLAFYMLRHGVSFIEAAKALGAWEVAR